MILCVLSLNFDFLHLSNFVFFYDIISIILFTTSSSSAISNLSVGSYLCQLPTSIF